MFGLYVLDGKQLGSIFCSLVIFKWAKLATQSYFLFFYFFFFIVFLVKYLFILASNSIRKYIFQIRQIGFMKVFSE